MNKVVINESACKGCGLCVEACPKNIVKLDMERLNTKGYNPAVCVDMDSCISCAFCATTCPDLAIEVNK